LQKALKSDSREVIVTDEIVFQHGTTMVRRLRLVPGEAMPWHRDPFQRVAVILGGYLLSIEAATFVHCWRSSQTYKQAFYPYRPGTIY